MEVIEVRLLSQWVILVIVYCVNRKSDTGPFSKVPEKHLMKKSPQAVSWLGSQPTYSLANHCTQTKTFTSSKCWHPFPGQWGHTLTLDFLVFWDSAVEMYWYLEKKMLPLLTF